MDKDNEQNKMKTLVLPFKDKVFRFINSIVGNTLDAEDIMQELLIKIWNRREQYQDIENKEAWCMTVARNMAIDKTRSRKVSITDIESYYHISDKELTPDKSYEQKESFGNIMKLLDELPEKQKMIVHLRDVEGYTYQEIADMTENTLDFVKISLHRARKTLKDKLLKNNYRRS